MTLEQMMAEDKSSRDSITWYFPPKNPPADLSGGTHTNLKDYFKPVEVNPASSVMGVFNGNFSSNSPGDVPVPKPMQDNVDCRTVDLTLKSLPDSDVTPASLQSLTPLIDSSDTDPINLNKRKMCQQTEELNEDSIADLSLDVDSSLLKKRIRYDNVTINEESNSSNSASSFPITRHKTKAFYKQVPPLEPQDLSAESVTNYHRCSKGIKKYFVSKAVDGLKSPRRAASHQDVASKSTSCSKVSNLDHKVTPLKKRKSKVIYDHSVADSSTNVYGFVDENLAIEPRNIRVTRKSVTDKIEKPITPPKSQPQRSSPRSKNMKLPSPESKRTPSIVNTRPRRNCSLKVNEISSCDDSNKIGDTPKKHSSNVQKFSNIKKKCVQENTSSNLRRSSRLGSSVTDFEASGQIFSESVNDISNPLESLYKTEVVDGDCLGSPIRLKFTRVGLKDIECESSNSEFPEPLKTMPKLHPKPLITKKKHSKKKHKKHGRNHKIDQYRAIVKKAIAKPHHLVTRIQNPVSLDGGRRSLRQSSILNRKAVEGAQKAEEMKRNRWAQQRLTSPTKRSLRRADVEPSCSLKSSPEKESPSSNTDTETNDRSNKISSSFTRSKNETVCVNAIKTAATGSRPKRKTVLSTTKLNHKKQGRNSSAVKNKENLDTSPIVKEAKSNLKTSSCSQKQVDTLLKDDIEKPIVETAVVSSRPSRKAKIAAVAKTCAHLQLGKSNFDNDVEQNVAEEVVEISNRPSRRAKTAAISKNQNIEKGQCEGTSKRVSPRKRTVLADEKVDPKSGSSKADPAKLAPLFCRPKKSSNKNLSGKNEEIQVKRTISDSEKLFLMSTASDFITNPKTTPSVVTSVVTSLGDVLFQKLVHVQQREDGQSLWNLESPNLKLKNCFSHETTHQIVNKTFRHAIKQCKRYQKVLSKPETLPEITRNNVLKRLEASYPKDSIRSIFNRIFTTDHPGLSKVSDLWTDFYSPTKVEELFGNTASFSSLYSWLQKWKTEVHKNTTEKSKVEGSAGSDSDSDFEPDFRAGKVPSKKDEEEDEDDYMCNTMLLSGSSGIGKTASVYAMAKQLGFKVFEVNASSKRCGKQIISQLQEVTQSMQVSKLNSSKQTEGIASFFSKSADTSDDTNQKKQESDHLTVSANSLLLFEDIDLVFNEDDGFYNAVNNFMSNTKRPIILTTNDPDFSLSNKLKGDYEELEFSSPPANFIIKYLQLICLANNVDLTSCDLQKLVRYYHGDIRKIFLSLQYLVSSGSMQEKLDEVSESPDTIKPRNSLQILLGLSSISTLSEFEKLERDIQIEVMNSYCDCGIDLLYLNYIKMLHLQKCYSSDSEFSPKKHSPNSKAESKSCTSAKNCLQTLSTYFENISACDSALISNCGEINEYISCGRNIEEKTLENTQLWRRDQQIINDAFSRNLACTNLQLNAVCNEVQCSSKLSDEELLVIDSPSSQLSYENNVHVAQKSLLKSGAIPLPCYFNSQAKSQDYYPVIRSICKSESLRSAVNSKRSGRFLHYLDSISVEILPSTQTALTKYFK